MKSSIEKPVLTSATPKAATIRKIDQQRRVVRRPGKDSIAGAKCSLMNFSTPEAYSLSGSVLCSYGRPTNSFYFVVKK